MPHAFHHSQHTNVYALIVIEPKALSTLTTTNKTSKPNYELSTEQRDVYKEKAIVANEGATSSVNVKNEWKKINGLLQDVVCVVN